MIDVKTLCTRLKTDGERVRYEFIQEDIYSFPDELFLFNFQT